MEKRSCDHDHAEHRLWLGIGIIIAGLLVLANNFDIFDYEIRRYILRWEMILIVLGLIFITSARKRTTGIVLLVIGGAIYLRNFMNLDFNFFQVFWPSMLILAGVMMIFRHRIDRDPLKKNITDNENVIDEIALFGGGDRIVNSQNFQGGKVTTIFGGLNYNMLKAKLAPGDNYIDVFSMFGGMKLIVPEGWTVKIQVMSLFGGFSDKHRYRIPEASTEQGSRLIIKGTVIFGGGEIKSFLD